MLKLLAYRVKLKHNIVKENTKIRIDRKRLFTILNKSSNTDIEKKWLENWKKTGFKNKKFVSQVLK